jgi:hypothetical protein
VVTLNHKAFAAAVVLPPSVTSGAVIVNTGQLVFSCTSASGSVLVNAWLASSGAGSVSIGPTGTISTFVRSSVVTPGAACVACSSGSSGTCQAATFGPTPCAALSLSTLLCPSGFSLCSGMWSWLVVGGGHATARVRSWRGIGELSDDIGPASVVAAPGNWQRGSVPPPGAAVEFVSVGLVLLPEGFEGVFGSLVVHDNTHLVLDRSRVTVLGTVTVSQSSSISLRGGSTLVLANAATLGGDSDLVLLPGATVAGRGSIVVSSSARVWVNGSATVADGSGDVTLSGVGVQLQSGGAISVAVSRLPVVDPWVPSHCATLRLVDGAKITLADGAALAMRGCGGAGECAPVCVDGDVDASIDSLGTVTTSGDATLAVALTLRDVARVVVGSEEPGASASRATIAASSSWLNSAALMVLRNSTVAFSAGDAVFALTSSLAVDGRVEVVGATARVLFEGQGWMEELAVTCGAFTVHQRVTAARRPLQVASASAGDDAACLGVLSVDSPMTVGAKLVLSPGGVVTGSDELQLAAASVMLCVGGTISGTGPLVAQERSLVKLGSPSSSLQWQRRRVTAKGTVIVSGVVDMYQGAALDVVQGATIVFGDNATVVSHATVVDGRAGGSAIRIGGAASLAVAAFVTLSVDVRIDGSLLVNGTSSLSIVGGQVTVQGVLLVSTRARLLVDGRGSLAVVSRGALTVSGVVELASGALSCDWGAACWLARLIQSDGVLTVGSSNATIASSHLCAAPCDVRVAESATLTYGAACIAQLGGSGGDATFRIVGGGTVVLVAGAAVNMTGTDALLDARVLVARQASLLLAVTSVGGDRFSVLNGGNTTVRAGESGFTVGSVGDDVSAEGIVNEPSGTLRLQLQGSSTRNADVSHVVHVPIVTRGAAAVTLMSRDGISATRLHGDVTFNHRFECGGVLNVSARATVTLALRRSTSVSVVTLVGSVIGAGTVVIASDAVLAVEGSVTAPLVVDSGGTLRVGSGASQLWLEEAPQGTGATTPMPMPRTTTVRGGAELHLLGAVLQDGNVTMQRGSTLRGGLLTVRAGAALRFGDGRPDDAVGKECDDSDVTRRDVPRFGRRLDYGDDEEVGIERCPADLFRLVDTSVSVEGVLRVQDVVVKATPWAPRVAVALQLQQSRIVVAAGGSMVVNTSVASFVAEDVWRSSLVIAAGGQTVVSNVSWLAFRGIDVAVDGRVVMLSPNSTLSLEPTTLVVGVTGELNLGNATLMQTSGWVTVYGGFAAGSVAVLYRDTRLSLFRRSGDARLLVRNVAVSDASVWLDRPLVIVTNFTLAGYSGTLALGSVGSISVTPSGVLSISNGAALLGNSTAPSVVAVFNASIKSCTLQAVQLRVQGTAVFGAVDACSSPECGYWFSDSYLRVGNGTTITVARGASMRFESPTTFQNADGSFVVNMQPGADMVVENMRESMAAWMPPLFITVMGHFNMSEGSTLRLLPRRFAGFSTPAGSEGGATTAASSAAIVTLRYTSRIAGRVEMTPTTVLRLQGDRHVLASTSELFGNATARVDIQCSLVRLASTYINVSIVVLGGTLRVDASAVPNVTLGYATLALRAPTVHMRELSSFNYASSVVTSRAASTIAISAGMNLRGYFFQLAGVSLVVEPTAVVNVDNGVELNNASVLSYGVWNVRGRLKMQGLDASTGAVSRFITFGDVRLHRSPTSIGGTMQPLMSPSDEPAELQLRGGGSLTVVGEVSAVPMITLIGVRIVSLAGSAIRIPAIGVMVLCRDAVTVAGSISVGAGSELALDGDVALDGTAVVDGDGTLSLRSRSTITLSALQYGKVLVNIVNAAVTLQCGSACTVAVSRIFVRSSDIQVGSEVTLLVDGGLEVVEGSNIDVSGDMRLLSSANLTVTDYPGASMTARFVGSASSGVTTSRLVLLGSAYFSIQLRMTGSVFLDGGSLFITSLAPITVPATGVLSISRSGVVDVAGPLALLGALQCSSAVDAAVATVSSPFLDVSVVQLAGGSAGTCDVGLSSPSIVLRSAISLDARAVLRVAGGSVSFSSTSAVNSLGIVAAAASLTTVAGVFDSAVVRADNGACEAFIV